MSLALRRILAALAATGLVVGAVVVRRAIDDDPGDDAGPVTTATEETDGDGPTVACIADLDAVCAALDTDRWQVRTESWTATLTAAAGGTPPDLWITVAPLSGLLTDAGEPVAVASTELIEVSRTDRSAVLTGTCGTDDLWSCVGAAAGEPWTELGGAAGWGSVLPGFADPAASAVGVLSLGAAAADYFGTEAFGSTQIESDDGFFGWFTRLAGSVPDDATADPLALLLRRPSAVNVVATTAAAFATLAGARAAEFTTAYPGPMARADAVVVATGERDVPDELVAELQDLLTENGWGPAIAGPNPLPSANTLVRLRSLWEESR